MTDSCLARGGLIRLNHWIDGNAISRSTAYELLKLCGIRPYALRVLGYRKPISHLDAEQIALLAPLVAKFKDGVSVAQIRRDFLADSTSLVESVSRAIDGRINPDEWLHRDAAYAAITAVATWLRDEGFWQAADALDCEA
jgi:hypothetical protein